MKLTYEKANELLQGRNRNSRKLGNNTYLIRPHWTDTYLALKLHSTEIMKFYPNGDIVFNTGGWQTVTTKARLNEYSNLRFYSQKGTWFVHEFNGTDWHDDKPFGEGMTQHADGSIDGYGEDPKAANKLRTKVKAYANAFVEELFNGHVPAPNNGDCFFCHMVDVNTGQPIKESSHILAHIKEKYYVPSLLWNALKWQSSQMDKWVVQEIWQGQKTLGQQLVEKIGYSNYHEMVKNDLRKILRRYILRELGLPS